MSEATNAPAEGEVGGPLTDFDKDFQTFMSHDFGTPELQEEDRGGETQSSESGAAGADSIQAGAGADTVAASDDKSKIETGEGSDSAATSASADGASTVQGGAGDDVVDPALLAAMAGFSAPAPEKKEQIAPVSSAVDKDGKTAPASSSEEDKDFMPFEPNFRLAPAVVSALFESEDPEVREKALVGLLSSYGNAIAATVMHEVKKVVLPATLTRYSESIVQDQTRNAVTNSFYAAFPELADYKPAVQKAFAIIAEREPGIVWGEATAKKIARLAEAALKNSGVPVTVKGLQTAATEQKPLPPVDTKKAPGSGFEAGGGRLSSEVLNSAEGPANLVKELTENW